jgi:predicted ThiF/HesA family dinucleotide-utilizing enzyme
MKISPEFIWRDNLVQITCLRCLAIVGAGTTPAALQILERAHRCKKH